MACRYTSVLLSVTALIYGEEATSQSPTPTAEPTSTKTLAKLKNDTETKKTTASAEKAKSSGVAKGCICYFFLFQVILFI